MSLLRSVVFFGALLPALLAATRIATKYAWPRLVYRFREWKADRAFYRKYVRPYDIAILGHRLVLVATKLFGKRVGGYLYRRVF